MRSWSPTSSAKALAARDAGLAAADMSVLGALHTGGRWPSWFHFMQLVAATFIQPLAATSFQMEYSRRCHFMQLLAVTFFRGCLVLSAT